jgi:WD40 repeat protein
MLAFSEAANETDFDLVVWDVVGGKEVTRFKKHWGGVFSGDGKSLVAFLPAGEIQRYDTATWKSTIKPGMSPKAPIPGHICLAVSPDGNLLAFRRTEVLGGGPDQFKEIVIWDIDKNARFASLEGFTREPLAGRFSPDGKLFALCCGWVTKEGYEPFGGAYVWDLTTQKQILREEVKVSLMCLAFAPDSKRIAVGSSHEGVIIWDIPAKKKVLVVRHKEEDRLAHDLVFSPDGNRLVTAGFSCRIQVWNAATGAPLGEAQLDGVWAHPLFSPNARRITLDARGAHTVGGIYDLRIE